MVDIVPEPVRFAEQINFLRTKLRLPTETWTDIWQEQHRRAFVVAGATEEALLADFQEALTAAIDDGTTLADFRKKFDAIVERHGWTYNGGPGWRSRVIFDTNLRTSNAAGRWEQIQRVKARRPWLRYVAVLDSRTRPEHRAWHGTVLPADDPWWSTHFPPNGWYCRCTVQSLSDRDLERFGYAPSPGAPAIELETRTAGDRVVQVPKGIDPGFAYNPGRDAPPAP